MSAVESEKQTHASRWIFRPTGSGLTPRRCPHSWRVFAIGRLIAQMSCLSRDRGRNKQELISRFVLAGLPAFSDSEDGSSGDSPYSPSFYSTSDGSDASDSLEGI